MTSPRSIELLTVLQWPRVGPVKAREIVASAAGASLIEHGRRVVPTVSDQVQATALESARRIVERCDALGISLIGLDDPEYPALLKRITDPPPLLYVRGDVAPLSARAVAVVGTRNVSESGSRVARMTARYVARRGFVVVSGLALGVDTLAHMGALDESSPTVAVMAHGLDTVSPASNRGLAERILSGGGALVSEHPPGFPARPQEFVRRNRLQSGISLASIVIESGVEGGSMHQANFTKKQGRRLLTILAASDESRGDLNEAGARHLVSALGAIPVRSTGDLGKELDNLGPPSEMPHQPSLGW